MKRFMIAFAFLILCAGVVFALRGVARKPAASEFVPGEILVQFNNSIHPDEANRLIAQTGAAIKERIDPQGIYVLSFPKTTPVPQMVSRFQQMPQVKHAEPNGIYQPSFLLDLVWPVEAQAADSSSTLGAGAVVKVAVIDTAIDANHPVLAGKVLLGYNFVNNTATTQSSGVGQDWHGTASSGRILDGAGDANVQIMPVQVFGTSGGASWSTIIKAINYAVDNGAQIINMSLGGYGSSPLVQEAIDRATAKGIIVVASAGNGNTEALHYPSSYNGVISVAATNEGGKRASFSNYGSTVDISAPGDTMRLLSHGGYTTAAGTSFSAPFITGMLAMLKSAFPFLSANQCEQVLKSKANSIDDKNPSFLGKLGAGLLNALDVKKWMDEIRAGIFQFPWGPAGQVGGVPGPVPAPAPQPWLIRGKGHGGNFIMTPSGEVAKEK